MRATTTNEPRLAARFLEQVLLVNLAVHLLAMIGTNRGPIALDPPVQRRP